MNKGYDPQFPQDYESLHPGKITNAQFLELDTTKYLPGLEVENAKDGKEADCIDRYI